MGVSKNATVAFYGKGGAGKSFLTSMVAKTLTERDNRVLQMGCDPKHDSVVTHFGGAFIPTVLGTWAQFQKAGKEEELEPSNVIFKGDGVYCIELGGPESARGCGGRGITFGFQLLEKWGLSEWNFNYMLLDFLGDVVCGGFGTPIARSMADKLIIVCSNEGQSMYAANNIASAVRYFADQGGKTRVLGLFVNKDDGSGKAQRLAERLDVPVLASLPVLPQREVMELATASASRRSDRQSHPGDQPVPARYPQQVDFHEFMCSLPGNAAEWTVRPSRPTSFGAYLNDPQWRRIRPSLHRSRRRRGQILVPTVVSVGGGAVPAGAWE